MPFQKGQSGNPVGRKPSGLSFWEMVQRASIQEDHKRIRMAAEKYLDAAAQGEQWAIREMFDRSDGKPAQAITGEGGGPVELVVKWAQSEKS